MSNRPKAILIIANFLFAASGTAAVVGISLLVPGTPLSLLWELNKPAYAAFHALGKASSLLLLTLAFVTAAAGTGLLRGRNWAWWIAVSVFAMNGFGDAVSFALNRDLVKSGSGAFIAAAFLFSLTRRRSMRFCGVNLSLASRT